MAGIRGVAHSWKAKAALQQAFSLAPGGQRLNLLFQRHVTHGLPMPDAKLREAVELAGHHVAMCRQHGEQPVEEATFFEFGAGWDLAMPLTLHRLGVTAQIVVDIRPLVRQDLVVDVLERLGDLVPGPEEDVSRDAALGRLLEDRGIDYRAPADARTTGLADGSVDYVTSTNTLEHIPPDDIASILRECHRILHPGGVMSFQIDYGNHYSYFDPTVSPYGYLAFSDRRWRRYNPSLHFQNRLRHADHLALIDDAGFDVIAETCHQPTADDLATVAGMALAEPWAARPVAALAVQDARMVLRARRP